MVCMRGGGGGWWAGWQARARGGGPAVCPAASVTVRLTGKEGRPGLAKVGRGARGARGAGGHGQRRGPHPARRGRIPPSIIHGGGYIYIYTHTYIYPLIYTLLPYSTWLHSKVRAKGTTWCIHVAEGTKLDQNGLKMGSKHLFVHPQWSKSTFGKTRF